MHQVQRIAVTHGLCKAVRDRQRKPRPLQQPSKIADFGHRQHTRRQAPRHVNLCFGQAGPQLVQCLSAVKESQKQPVGAQGVATLHQLTDRIAGPVQAKCMDHQVMRARCQRKNVVIRHHHAEIAPKGGKRRNDSRRCKGSVNLNQSFLGLGKNLFVQEKSRRTAAVVLKGGAIGDLGRRLHGAERGAGDMGMQAALLHLIYPPQCIACDTLVTSDFGLCGDCWRETPFITGMVCDMCGSPLPGQDPTEVAHCDACMTTPRPWSRGRAALLYKDRGRDLVLQLKHADRLDLARPAGDWAARAVAPILCPGMLVAPVPLHWFRLFRRRYNQSALLSAHVARIAGLQHVPDLLRRTRTTGSQEGRSRDQRFANLSDAMQLHPRRAAMAAGRHILLIDDVMTSGATLSAAAEACLAGGAAEISVLCLTRVAKDA